MVYVSPKINELRGEAMPREMGTYFSGVYPVKFMIVTAKRI
jgi:hypothetical protein